MTTGIIKQCSSMFPLNSYYSIKFLSEIWHQDIINRSFNCYKLYDGGFAEQACWPNVFPKCSAGLQFGKFVGFEQYSKIFMFLKPFFIYNSCNGVMHIVLLKDATAIVEDCCHEEMYLVFSYMTKKLSHINDKIQCFPVKHFPNHHTPSIDVTFSSAIVCQR